MISEIHSLNGIGNHFKSKANPFATSPSAPNTNTPISPASHFDSQAAKVKVQELMEVQDSGKIFQSKNLLGADPNYLDKKIMANEVKSSIKKRKKSVF